MANLNYESANNIEKILEDIESLVTSMQNYYVYSGVARSGQRRLWQNRFRRLYQPKEYLESSGTQYIDTGVSGAIQAVIDLELTSVTPSGTNYTILWAENQGSPYECNGVRCNNYQTGVNIPFFQLGNGGTAQDDTKEALINTRYTIAIDTNPDSYYLEVNGEMQVQGTSSGYPLTSYNLFLFANNAGTTAKQFGKIKLYSCKIYKDNVLVRDFIPVTTTEHCLLDRVSGVFYYNQGTGTFS